MFMSCITTNIRISKIFQNWCIYQLNEKEENGTVWKQEWSAGIWVLQPITPLEELYLFSDFSMFKLWKCFEKLFPNNYLFSKSPISLIQVLTLGLFISYSTSLCFHVHVLVTEDSSMRLNKLRLYRRSRNLDQIPFWASTNFF